MPDRLPPIDAERRARRRAPAPPRASAEEVLALAERAAAIPDGLALLEGAPLECIAVLLGVEPRTIERVRVALADAALREEAALRFARARGRRAPRSAASPPAAPAPSDPDALLRAARARPEGLAQLLEASPEAAAILFGVHPDLVLRAREAAGRGAAAPPG